jgi:hypothetical protein
MSKEGKRLAVNLIKTELQVTLNITESFAEFANFLSGAGKTVKSNIYIYGTN